MSDKSVILKNIDGDKIFPIIPYTNIIGAPHPLNSDVTIFYGTGVPVNTKSTYENIKEDDLYIDRDNTYGIGIYRCGLTTDTTVVWRGLSNGVYYPDDPITETTPWLARFQITPNIGLIYVNSNTGDIFILTGKQVPNLTWTKVTGGNSTNIFYGNGVPTSTKSDYENIKLDDLYIDRNKTYALCIYRCAAIPNPEVVIWQSTESDIKDVGEPPTTFTEVNNKYKIFLKVGITYTDTRYGDVYILTEINNLVLTWTKVNGDKLPVSTSSDAGKVLTVDQNGDPYWEDVPKSNPIEATKSGNAITLNDSAAEKLSEIKIMGKSTQNGTPTIDNPIDIIDTTTESIEITDGTNTQTGTLSKILRGIPVTGDTYNYIDQNNQKWICDTIEKYKDGTGKLIQRVNRVTFKGTESWRDFNGHIVFYNFSTDIKPLPSSDIGKRSLNTHFSTIVKNQTVVGDTDNSYYISTSYIALSPTINGSRLDAAGFKTWLSTNNMILEYCLNTPIETPLTAEEMSQLKQLHTYYPTSTINADPYVEVTYIADTKNYIDNKFAELQNAIVSQGGNV